MCLERQAAGAGWGHDTGEAMRAALGLGPAGVGEVPAPGSRDDCGSNACAAAGTLVHPEELLCPPFQLLGAQAIASVLLVSMPAAVSVHGTPSLPVRCS